MCATFSSSDAASPALHLVDLVVAAAVPAFTMPFLVFRSGCTLVAAAAN